MASFNKIILIGNLVADPELKQTNSGINYCSFSIAVNRRFTKSVKPPSRNISPLTATSSPAAIASLTSSCEGLCEAEPTPAEPSACAASSRLT